MMFRRNNTLLLVLFMFAMLLFVSQCFAQFEELGIGLYHISETDVDTAIYDWLMINFGSIEPQKYMARYNNILKINRDFKFFVRLWPIMNLGGDPRNRYQAMFLDYFYAPGMKEKLFESAREQIQLVFNGIDKPENVVAFSFLEEEPVGAFGQGKYWGSTAVYEEGQLPWIVEIYRDQIEKEMGHPIKYNEELRRFLGKKYTQAMREIHTFIKEETGGRLVFYWLQTNCRLEGDPEASGLGRQFPFSWDDIIIPGIVDGIFGYPNSQEQWEQRDIKVAKEHNCLLFAQLSHPGFMRLSSWDETVKRVNMEFEQHAGYFLYCEPGCQRGRFNDDPDTPEGEDNNTKHALRFASQMGIGRDILKRELKMKLAADCDLRNLKKGQQIVVNFVIQNPKTIEHYYATPKEAIAEAVELLVDNPSWLEMVDHKEKINIGDLQPGEIKTVKIKMRVTSTPDISDSIKISAISKNTASGFIELKPGFDIVFSSEKVHIIDKSPYAWYEPSFRLARNSNPTFNIAATREVINPKITIGNSEILFEGKLSPRESLVIDTRRKKATFYGGLLINASEADFKNPNTGDYYSYSEGYIAKTFSSNQKLRPNSELLIVVEGRAEGGANSNVYLLFRDADTGAEEGWSVLTNQFTSKWTKVSTTVKPPFENSILAGVYIYRFNRVGTVWYKDLTVSYPDAPIGGKDVTSQLKIKNNAYLKAGELNEIIFEGPLGTKVWID